MFLRLSRKPKLRTRLTLNPQPVAPAVASRTAPFAVPVVAFTLPPLGKSGSDPMLAAESEKLTLSRECRARPPIGAVLVQTASSIPHPPTSRGPARTYLTGPRAAFAYELLPDEVTSLLL